MTQWTKQRLAVLCVACVLFGWLAHGWADPPKPQNRPVLTWIARAARTALLFFFFADKPPEDQSNVQHPMADGSLPVDHGRAI